MFLTPDELRTLTGYRRPTEQRAWLDRNGIVYFTALSGRPVVNVAQLTGQPPAERDADPDEHRTHPWRMEGKPLDLWLIENSQAWKLTLVDIQSKALPYKRGAGPAASGIYFLFDDAKSLLYVGQSTNITWRLVGHRRAGTIPFASFACIELPSGSLNEVERHYIKRMKPPYNVKGML